MKRTILKALANVTIVLNDPKAAQTAVDYQSQVLDDLIKLAPSGNGFDAGTEFVSVRSNSRRLVFKTAFHHMDGNGHYDGWTHHTVTALPDLLYGFLLVISGKDRNGIKELIHDTFNEYLNSETAL